MARAARSADGIEENLREQLRFLRSSAVSDDGLTEGVPTVADQLDCYPAAGQALHALRDGVEPSDHRV